MLVYLIFQVGIHMLLVYQYAHCSGMVLCCSVVQAAQIIAHAVIRQPSEVGQRKQLHQSF